MELTKILVATDFSEPANMAFEQSLRIARRTGAEVIAVYATPDRAPPADADGSPLWGVPSYVEVVRARLEGYREQLEAMKARGRELGVRVSAQLVEDFPDTGIIHAASSLHADLIVVGTHGRTGFMHLLLGSVAERAVRGADTNVLVARAPGDPDTRGYARVLVPTDFGPTAERALQAALILSSPEAEIDVLNFWHAPVDLWGPVTATNPDLAAVREALGDAAERDGAALMGRYAAACGERTLCFEHVEDTPARGIQRRLEQERYDLVCMGSHGYRGLRRWVLGSVADKVVHHANCSVLVVRAVPD